MKQLGSSRQVVTHRRAFTLLELLVVISIIAILLTMTLLAVNLNNEADRVKKGARQVQSFLLGARDRAIKRGEDVGVRFFFGQPPASADANTTQIIARQVTSMAYIVRSGTWPLPDGPPDAIERVAVTDLNADTDTNDAGEMSIFSTSTAWWSLKRRGWLADGLFIRVPDSSTGSIYQIDTSFIDVSNPPAAETELRLLTPNNGNVSAGMSYSIEMPWTLLAEEPSILPENVVIDLDGSRIPQAWRPSAAADLYRSYIDIIFSPRGTIVGDASAAGLLHFYVCDAEDSLFLKEQYVANQHGGDFSLFNTEVAGGAWFVPVDEIDSTVIAWPGVNYNVKPRRLVSVVPTTGAVSVHDVYAYIDPEIDITVVANTYPTDTDKNGIADDPFRFAETGEAAN